MVFQIFIWAPLMHYRKCGVNMQLSVIWVLNFTDMNLFVMTGYGGFCEAIQSQTTIKIATVCGHGKPLIRNEKEFNNL